MTEDEMVGWHHQLDGHEFEQAPGVGDGWRPSVLRSMGVTESRTRLKRLSTSNVITDKRVFMPAILLFFFWAPKSLQMVIAAMKLKDTSSLEGKL